MQLLVLTFIFGYLIMFNSFDKKCNSEVVNR